MNKAETWRDWQSSSEIRQASSTVYIDELAPAPDPLAFTIITVVKNNVAGFRATAESIVSQNCPSYEWIVIDGGSIDGTEKLIEQFAPYISVAISGEDDGIYDAMNKGLALSRGEFVLFLNSGDVFSKVDSLSHAARLVNDIDDSVSMILAGAICQYPFGHQVVMKPRKVSEYLWHSNPASHQATFIRRHLHQHLPYNKNLIVAADYDLMCRMFQYRPKCAYIDQALVRVSRGGQSFSHRHVLTHFIECIRVQRDVLALPWATIVRSLARRSVSYIGESLLSQRASASVVLYAATKLRRELR
jgi:putative colanic acid biosynthesis glycosyltransferase